MKHLGALLCLAALGAAPVTASIIHVPSDWPTIQAGINAASSGDIVLVEPGTYVENINFMGKAITVKSSNGPKYTIIDGNGVAPVAAFVTHEGTKSILSGFTLQDGVGTFDFQYQGGGVSISYSSPTITHNVITKNSAGDGGGVGVYFGSPIISGNSITKNYAQFGGGIAFVGSSNGEVLHNTISNNTAGSGAAAELFGAANVFIEGNRIVGNSASYGGGFWIVNESDEVIVQNLFAKNRASSGSQIYSLIPHSVKGFALINNTIVSAPNGNADAAVIADGFNTNVLIENNIIYAAGDKAALLCNPIYNDGPPVVEFNDAFNSTLAYGDSCSAINGAHGNISFDPMLESVTKGKYQLSFDSPAVNAGSNSAPSLPTRDLAGKPRISGGTIDMGAYEYQQ
jgi:parallel beta-helix repeat protein